MSDWTGGYVTDLGYTHGFYRELTPAILQFATLAKGDGAAMGTPVNYCELGCGQGFSVNLLAAANPHIEFYATDFNPAQIAGAQSLARAGGAKNIHFFDQSFQQFINEPSLPQFDVIALHGIYSWIAAEHRASIVNFIDAHLKPGGIVYISYNSLPGWSAFMPLRRILVDHAATGNGSILPRIEAALGFADAMRNSNAAWFRRDATTGARLDSIKGQNRQYLAHEYFNREWTPFYHGDVAADLSRARLGFLCSAHLPEHVDAINIQDDHKQILQQVSDPATRETMRDYFGNQQFRRDIFVRGARDLPEAVLRENWLDQRFALSSLKEDVPMKINGWLGEATMQPEIYGPILTALGRGPRTLRDIVSGEDAAGQVVGALSWSSLRQALTILVGTGHLQPALDAAGDEARRQSTQNFNLAVMERARYSTDLAALASPVTGGGVSLGRFQQLFLLAWTQGHSRPDQWADFVMGIITAQGQLLVKDGKALETPEENRAELLEQAQSFAAKTLPVLQSLLVA